MALTSEAKIKQKIKAILNKNNVYYFFPIGGPYGRSGIPDIIGCANGRFFAIEVKADKRGNTVTQLQQKELNAIGFNGGKTWVVVGEEAVKQFENVFSSWVEYYENT